MSKFTTQNRPILIALLLFFCVTHDAVAQRVALRNNLLYDATLTPNLGAEMKLDSAWSVGLNVGLNAWDINKSSNKKWRHFLVSPNVRWYHNHKRDTIAIFTARTVRWTIMSSPVESITWNWMPSTATSMWATPASRSVSIPPSRTVACKVTSLHWVVNMVIVGFSPATGVLRPRLA